MQRVIALVAFIILSISLQTEQSNAHCQVPCGIYDDARQFDVIEEHAKTIEKAMNQINKLSEQKTANYHMITRWTLNKEKHAQMIQDIAHAYFLTQRVKTADSSDEKAYADYVKHTTLLHQILVAAMKCKQTTEPKHVKKLRKLASDYKDHYFSARHKH